MSHARRLLVTCLGRLASQHRRGANCGSVSQPPAKTRFDQVRFHGPATALGVGLRTVSLVWVDSEMTGEQLSRPPRAVFGQQYRLGFTLRV